eukprot:363649-Chlamydomonas_euryale.AAC.5
MSAVPCRAARPTAATAPARRCCADPERCLRWGRTPLPPPASLAAAHAPTATHALQLPSRRRQRRRPHCVRAAPIGAAAAAAAPIEAAAAAPMVAAAAPARAKAAALATRPPLR